MIALDVAEEKDKTEKEGFHFIYLFHQKRVETVYITIQQK